MLVEAITDRETQEGVEPEEENQAMDTLEEHKVHNQEKVGTQLMQLLKEPSASFIMNTVAGQRSAKDYHHHRTTN